MQPLTRSLPPPARHIQATTTRSTCPCGAALTTFLPGMQQRGSGAPRTSSASTCTSFRLHPSSSSSRAVVMAARMAATAAAAQQPGSWAWTPHRSRACARRPTLRVGGRGWACSIAEFGGKACMRMELQVAERDFWALWCHAVSVHLVAHPTTALLLPLQAWRAQPSWLRSGPYCSQSSSRRTAARPSSLPTATTPSGKGLGCFARRLHVRPLPQAQVVTAHAVLVHVPTLSQLKPCLVMPTLTGLSRLVAAPSTARSRTRWGRRRCCCMRPTRQPRCRASPR